MTRFHWIVSVNGEKFLSPQGGIDAAVFSALRRWRGYGATKVTIKCTFAVRPKGMSFAAYRRMVEKRGTGISA